MKYFITFILCAFFLNACEITDSRREQDVDSGIINVPVSAQGDMDMDLPNFEFEKEEFDFGTISQGEKKSFSFRFKNNGEADLVITKVEGSCGCTVLQGWPKHPIAPGKTGKIDVIFDSNGKKGIQNKTISVVANTYPSTTVLKIKGEVASPN